MVQFVNDVTAGTVKNVFGELAGLKVPPQEEVWEECPI